MNSENMLWEPVYNQATNFMTQFDAFLEEIKHISK